MGDRCGGEKDPGRGRGEEEKGEQKGRGRTGAKRREMEEEGVKEDPKSNRIQLKKNNYFLFLKLKAKTVKDYNTIYCVWCVCLNLHNNFEKIML